MDGVGCCWRRGFCCGRMATSALYACTKCNQRYPFEELSQGQQLCKVPPCVRGPAWLQARHRAPATVPATGHRPDCPYVTGDRAANASDPTGSCFDDSKGLCCETKDGYTSATPVVQPHAFHGCGWIVSCMPTCCSSAFDFHREET